MAYLIGVDGGGSNLRVVLTTLDLTVVAEAHAETVNPSVVGRELAATRLQLALTSVLTQAGLDSGSIEGVGIGVAGASAEYATDWLRATVGAVLPGARCVASSDIEIALVGAHGARYGVLVLAGTGSVALAIDRRGNSARAGGWGYLLGDEGGGYWIGLEALRAVTRALDGSGPATVLSEKVLSALDLTDVQAITLWLYGGSGPRTRDVARLAPLVCAVAEAGDGVAMDIVARGARALAELCRTVIDRLVLDSPPIAFAGGLLSAATSLRNALQVELGLDAVPEAKYPPVLGAALLARLVLEASMGRNDAGSGRGSLP